MGVFAAVWLKHVLFSPFCGGSWDRLRDFLGRASMARGKVVAKELTNLSVTLLVRRVGGEGAGDSLHHRGWGNRTVTVRVSGQFDRQGGLQPDGHIANMCAPGWQCDNHTEQRYHMQFEDKSKTNRYVPETGVQYRGAIVCVQMMLCVGTSIG